MNVLNWRYAQKIKENFTDEISIYNCWFKLAGYGAKGIHTSQFQIKFQKEEVLNYYTHVYISILDDYHDEEASKALS